MSALSRSVTTSRRPTIFSGEANDVSDDCVQLGGSFDCHAVLRLARFFVRSRETERAHPRTGRLHALGRRTEEYMNGMNRPLPPIAFDPRGFPTWVGLFTGEVRQGLRRVTGSWG